MAALSRPERRGSPGRLPLLVIAGLPAATAAPAAATINNDPDSRWRAIATPFGRDDAAIYADRRATLELGRLVCEFALDAPRDPEGVPTPSRIALACVRCEGSDRLWEVFGHAVWPIRLDDPDRRAARHWRHEIETVNALLGRAIGAAQSEHVEATRLRLEARRSDDPLLLPPRNFHLDGERRLAGPFLDFMKGDLDLDAIGPQVHAERFAFERLAEFYKRMGGAGKRFAVDDRGLVFAKANHGQHGGRPTIGQGAEITPQLLRRVLEARYRFGTPLEPEGFQHDVQREGGEMLSDEPFDCVIRGAIRLSGSHVNVFPSDVVTGGVQTPVG